MLQNALGLPTWRVITSRRFTTRREAELAMLATVPEHLREYVEVSEGFDIYL